MNILTALEHSKPITSAPRYASTQTHPKPPSAAAHGGPKPISAFQSSTSSCTLARISHPPPKNIRISNIIRDICSLSCHDLPFHGAPNHRPHRHRVQLSLCHLGLRPTSYQAASLRALSVFSDSDFPPCGDKILVYYLSCILFCDDDLGVEIVGLDECLVEELRAF